ncbi:hypothetical protein CcCBS67573_g04307 [Chytriomyces confervae]|uniref:Uncharacterized protein n=1 Tax=Chytriomyces confervae TaxID=246404 RepID=A0A507FGH7_9FUNG|nr:hypothetical protein HDU80_000481 [Chytriomyces hyalinus]TPX74428.1 hypothetical protein CcCBS67573_g04307 [Chytriomyces confervae]
MDSSWLLLLLGDSALPTGGFVASSGLEAFTSAFGFSQSEMPKVHVFMRSNMSAFAYAALPFVTQTFLAVSNGGMRAPAADPAINHDSSTTHMHQNATDDSVDIVAQLDSSFDAMVASNQIAARASRAQGAAFVALLDRAFLGVPMGSLDDRKLRLAKDMRKRVRGGKSPGHLPICFALLCACLGVSLSDTQSLFLFHHTRSLVSAAVRLNIYGPYEGQRQMLLLGAHASHVLKQVRDRMDAIEMSMVQEPSQEQSCVNEEDEYDRMMRVFKGPLYREVELAKRQSVQTGVMVELVQGLHDRLYSRLFNS